MTPIAASSAMIAEIVENPLPRDRIRALIDPVSPFLDTVCRVQLDPARSVSVWLDAGSVEVLDDHGLLSLTLQHRMTGDQWALRRHAA